ncbi:DMT family transporter [Roseitalea porphyridii]|uniref:DMT family transporter n=1 Tax=Roseitalea porphyridii TaxID=1852022 RepID=A0A4P6UXX2_9HYPH|nr:DMT family transporter [Roseitalea porphyridii]QBK29333.1 DMT family transporter [Roseitalea porphyridii]
MELWIPITIAAAFVQNMRSGLQRHLRTKMGTTGATFVRFGFGLPVAFALLVFVLWLTGTSLPASNGSFWLWVTVGAFAQILAQALLVIMFTRRSFAVGSAYSRTEPIQAVIFGLVFLSERAAPSVLAAIAISVSGVIVLTLARQPVGEMARGRSPLALLASPTALIGLVSGTFFGLAAVAFRAASLSLSGPNFLVQAGLTLCVAITMQTIAILVWMAVRDRAELRRIADAWRIGALTGLAGALASFGWFSAMTLQQAGAVKALAQIEMLFAYATTVLIFREPINRAEIAGCALVAAGVIVLVVA